MGSIVYIVEDDPAVRRSLLRLLRVEGYEAELFESAEAFLALQQPQPRSCLLLDVTLPGLDGFELQRRLVETGRALPIIFMTGNEDVSKECRAMVGETVAFLRKPMAVEALLAAVRAAIAVGDPGSPGPC